MPEIKKLSLAFLVPKLRGFPLFNNFLDLVDFSLFDFHDLDNFEAFNFSNFLAYFILLSSFFLEASLLLLFLLETGLLLLFLLGASLLVNLVVFNIKISRAIILLKP